jgi:ribonuclease HI
VTLPGAKRVHGVSDLAEFRARLEALRAEDRPPDVAGDHVAYTDGACFGNPDGPGGWGAAVFPPGAGVPWKLWGHLSSTTNNRAEALGVLAALEWIPADSRLELHSDSELTIRILEGRYKAKANPEIWEVIRRTIAEKRLSVVPEWVRGHAGDPGNELADLLSKLGAANGDLELLARLDGTDTAPRPKDPPELVGLVPQGEWEQNFVSSVKDQLRRGRKLSEKQQAIVDRMRARKKKSDIGSQTSDEG